MFRVLFVLLILLLVTALLVVLQVWLCKKSTTLGLILPAISLVLSVPVTVFVAFNMVGAGPQNILVIVAAFLAANTLTIIFGGIWLHYGGMSQELVAEQQANLIKWAIICQTAFLCSTAHFAYMIRSDDNDAVYRWSLAISLVALLLCSKWVITNHRFEQDEDQRRKNINIELGYCGIQLLLSLLTIYSGKGLVGVTLILLVEFVYLLYINPNFMNRKLTR